MEERVIAQEQVRAFEAHLLREEKSRATVEKYLRDVRAFRDYIQDQSVTRERLIAYKQELIARGYAVRTINSVLASLGSLLSYLGWTDCKVRAIKTQRQVYCPEEKELTREEYLRLVSTSQKKGNERLQMLLQTICGTGIRVSELRFITVEAAQRGEAVVTCKGKTRRVFIVKKLQRQLLQYARKRDIKQGPIFVTKTGKLMNRSNIWREMKSLCKEAGVDPRKVFPHNLRHLFARAFYSIQKDISRLADVLGHSSIDTTRIYIISSGFEHRRLLERMHLIM